MAVLVIPDFDNTPGEHYDETSVRIGAFEIDDAELRGETQGERTLSIPCKSDPDLCMQLDARDADTSVPAILDGEHSVLTASITIVKPMPGHASCLTRENPPEGGLFITAAAPA